MKNGVLIYGVRSMGDSLSTFSIFGRVRQPKPAKGSQTEKKRAGGRTDREAVSGDWARVGEDIRNAAGKVMAREG